MSQRGITIAKDIFTSLQLSRNKLIHMGFAKADTPSGKQDILLGQMLEKMKEATKEDFMRILDGKYPA